MEICKFLTVIFVAIVVLYSVQAAEQGGDHHSMACMQKLMPCQNYIHAVNPAPPASCCGPMKEIVEKDSKCLCTVFNNPELLKSLNLTKENALDLPKACGVNPDVSICTKTASSPPIASPTSGGSSVQAVSIIGLAFAFAFVARILY
ncbi:non-specific lipid-transfer protein [Brassica rapa]|uniref:non-specific lipid-transfer protein n=1 Tax=Brassica campestris TaxID=3711 RepID=UPI0004F199D2|nr:non-specific lipid-transfer protein [Brassica rapa]